VERRKWKKRVGCRLRHAAHPLLEHFSLFQRQRVRLGDDRHDVDHLCELLEHDDIDLVELACTACITARRGGRSNLPSWSGREDGCVRMAYVKMDTSRWIREDG
jgi:hypothetical protein